MCLNCIRIFTLTNKDLMRCWFGPRAHFYCIHLQRARLRSSTRSYFIMITSSSVLTCRHNTNTHTQTHNRLCNSDHIVVHTPAKHSAMVTAALKWKQRGSASHTVIHHAVINVPYQSSCAELGIYSRTFIYLSLLKYYRLTLEAWVSVSGLCGVQGRESVSVCVRL